MLSATVFSYTQNDLRDHSLSVTLLTETTVKAELFDVPTEHGVLYCSCARCVCPSSSFALFLCMMRLPVLQFCTVPAHDVSARPPVLHCSCARCLSVLQFCTVPVHDVCQSSSFALFLCMMCLSVLQFCTVPVHDVSVRPPVLHCSCA